MRKILFYILVIFFLSGCATTSSSTSGNLGKSHYRNVVILGEHVGFSDIDKQYSEKYNAIVLYTRGRGMFSDGVSKAITGTFGPSKAMRDVINELKSINYTEGEWKLIIPQMAERYFLVTLRNMEDGSLANVNGAIYLIDSQGNEPIEQEAKRVSHGSLAVRYKLD